MYHYMHWMNFDFHPVTATSSRTVMESPVTNRCKCAAQYDSSTGLPSLSKAPVMSQSPQVMILSEIERLTARMILKKNVKPPLFLNPLPNTT